MAKSSEVPVSDEDKKTLENLDNEIADRVEKFVNIMSKYVDVSVKSESRSNFGYSRKPLEGGPRACHGHTYIDLSTVPETVYCYDDCRGLCYAGHCRDYP